MANTYPACPAPTIRLGRPGHLRARQAGEELLVNGQHLPRLSRPYHSPGAARPGHLRARQAGEELLVNGQHLPRLSRPQPWVGCLFCPGRGLGCGPAGDA
ncbi:MAG: hypothetical protein H6666_17075 [Ardenticatenaceae bacterium]|nr:hypothetical protein [Ardenticatenaceae bacterium]